MNSPNCCPEQERRESGSDVREDGSFLGQPRPFLREFGRFLGASSCWCGRMDTWSVYGQLAVHLDDISDRVPVEVDIAKC